VRRVRYGVGMSLDGFIADAHGATDWLVADPTLDPREFLSQIDTVVMGRRSYDVMRAAGVRTYPGLRTYVASRTLAQSDVPEVTVITGDVAAAVSALRAEPGERDIWLAGGGMLGAVLLAAGLIDTIEVGISPRLLAQPGRPIFDPTTVPSTGDHTPPIALELSRSRTLPTGVVVLEYTVLPATMA